ncbi:helix-turn-helix domain-containing protein [Thermomonas hydrothermalis]|uniref:Helix-turn-helix n=1 Tax=Thermomonas hydrothermalis TaxID=213588 RepID=A0A1M5AQB6_9GAMM|nr:helix-turn-helix transcriptional regulator [Thermomonas hydrothermalis]SHF32375.1 Helix-turn-helix [Thermomonas hydrothermalis]
MKKTHIASIDSFLIPPVATPEEVRIKRQQMGLLQRELADLLGVTEFSVYRWETGKRSITPAHTQRLREVFAEWHAKQRAKAKSAT